MEGLLVSVAVIVYNHYDYLRQALDSILSQKINCRYEIVVGDDASTDGSQEIIKEYAKRYDCVFPILREKNVGAVQNSFDTYCHCKGKYLCVLEGDDYIIDENKIQNQLNYLEAHPELSCVAARRKRVNEVGEVIPYKHYKETEVITPKNLSRQKEMVHLSTFMFRNIFLDQSARNEYQKLHTCHSIISDWSTLVYFLDKSDIYVFPQPVTAIRRVLRASASNYSSIYKFRKNQYDVIVERMEYEQRLSACEYKRLRIKYSVFKKAVRFWYALHKDKNAESKAYGKKLYRERMLPRLNIAQRLFVPLGIVSIYFSAIKEQIFLRTCAAETKSEMN